MHPDTRRASRGGLLLVSGGYAIWYGRYELAVYGGNLSEDSVVEVGTNLQTRFTQFALSMGSTRIALAVVAVTAATYLLFRLRHNSRDTLKRSPEPGPHIPELATPPDWAASRETTKP